MMVGRQFTTAGPLTHEGVLSISSGYHRPALFAVSGALTNYDPTTRTLAGADPPCILQFPGADIVNNAAAIDLIGPLAKITDELGRGALRNFAHNSPGAFLRVTGLDFTTRGDFRNDGTLLVGGRGA